MTLVAVAVDERDGAIRVALEGELDLSGAAEVQHHLDEAAGSPLSVLDLRRLEFMDSTGLRLVLRADELARSRGNRFVIVRGPDTVQRLFETVGLDSRLDFVDVPPGDEPQ